METIISDEELERAGFYWRELDGVRALVCAPLEEDGFTNGFSTRCGGTSPMPENSLNLAGFNEDNAENILENRRRFLKLFAGDWSLAGCWQVHGSDVRVVENAAGAKPAEDSLGDTVYCDAIVSNAARRPCWRENCRLRSGADRRSADWLFRRRPCRMARHVCRSCRVRRCHE